MAIRLFHIAVQKPHVGTELPGEFHGQGESAGPHQRPARFDYPGLQTTLSSSEILLVFLEQR
jgi:hypothetical protein